VCIYKQVSEPVLPFLLLLQERTSRYVARLARELIELLRAGTGALADLVNFNLLKFKERDALEDVLRSWTSAAAGAQYDVAALRDTRLRHFFGKCSSSSAAAVQYTTDMASYTGLFSIGFAMRSCDVRVAL
jgi:Domain of unknown function (DUF4471)